MTVILFSKRSENRQKVSRFSVHHRKLYLMPSSTHFVTMCVGFQLIFYHKCVFVHFTEVDVNSDNGQTQEKHLLQILSAVLKWVDPPAAVIAAVLSGRPERFFDFSSST